MIIAATVWGLRIERNKRIHESRLVSATKIRRRIMEDIRTVYKAKRFKASRMRHEE